MPTRLREHSAKLITLGLFFMVILWALSSGASDHSLWQFLSQTDQQWEIFLAIRLPRVLVAGICGLALALAGVVSQGLFRNPLAGPTILGTTSGANVLVVIALFLGIGLGHWFFQPMIAFLGATLSTILVMTLARSRAFVSSQRLLLAGFALNSVFAAITTFILSLSLAEYGLSQAIVYWLLGGCNGKGWHHVLMGLPWLTAGIFLAFYQAKKLDVMNLGEDLARSLSVSIESLRVQSILAMAMLVASSVALCGGIGFIGLIVPHITRLYAGPEHSRLMLLSMFNGASLLIAADTVARTWFLPHELQVGAIIALIGAPLFLALLVRESKDGRLHV